MSTEKVLIDKNKNMTIGKVQAGQDLALLKIERVIREILTFEFGRKVIEESFPKHLAEEKHPAAAAWSNVLQKLDEYKRLKTEFNHTTVPDYNARTHAIGLVASELIRSQSSDYPLFIEIWKAIISTYGY